MDWSPGIKCMVITAIRFVVMITMQSTLLNCNIVDLRPIECDLNKNV